MTHEQIFSYICNIRKASERIVTTALLLLFCSVITSAQEVFSNEDLTISRLKDKTWVVETSDKTTMYIIEGEHHAMLIDTGTKCKDLDKVVRNITNKPLYVVITHLHPDHAGNIGYFDEVYLHPSDTVMMSEYQYDGKINYLQDGQTFDLGGITMQTVWLPCHTPGSIVMVNKQSGDCFTGDAVGSWQVWLHLEPHTPMTTIVKSYARLLDLMKKGEVKYLWCGHYPYVKTYYGIDYFTTMKTLAERVSKGDIKSAKPFQMPPSIHAKGNSKVLQKGKIMLVFNADKIN